MEGSLRTIQRAVNETMRHDVKVTTASWTPVPNNPFPCVVGKPGDAPAGHASILASIRRCIAKASEGEGWPNWDGICFLEHDVLYPPGYFDRMGDALASGAGVISHLDYEGVNKTGWCRTTNRHEPMHQMGMRRDAALANLARAEDECRRNGGCLIEPDSVLPCNRQTSSGLLGVDFDGTLTAGHVPLFQDFVVISGRHISEQAEVRKVVGPNRAIFLRTNDTPPTDQGIAVHKAKIILEMSVVEFWEDNEVQARLIQEACPKVVVHHVSGPPRMPDRSHWHRIGPSAHDKRPFGLTPSIHVNGPWAFTGHGAVCYEDKSSLGTTHPFWGQASQWLEGASMGCPGGCTGGQQGQQGGAPTIPAPTFNSLDEWVAHASKSGSDFNEHVEFLRDLAKGLDTVVEMCLWMKPSLPALLASQPKKLISLHPLGKGQQWADAKRFLPEGVELVTGPDTPPEPCDLLFHDKNHEASAVTADLERWGPFCRRFIILHCTEIYGEKGDLGGPGVRHAVRDWVRRHPEWTVVHNRKNNYGLMVLSRDDRDKKRIPWVGKLALNYAKAKAKHLMNGGTYLPLPMVKDRFDECAVCDQHTGGRCADCGCWLLLVPDDSPIGAGQPGRLFRPELNCPLGKWPERPKDGIIMSAEQIQEQVERWDE